MKCKNVAALTGPKQVMCISIFFAVFEKYISWSINALLSIYINSPFLNLGKAAIPLLKKSTIPDATPTKKIVINLEEPDEINKNTALSNP